MSGVAQLCCSNCSQPLRALTLEGHYGREVEIDVCDACCLIWFDTVESARLAGPGIAQLIATIHEAMSGHAHPHAMTVAASQQCVHCAARLNSVFNISRFGRTSQLQCPNGHGYFQTFMLYLAEKGYVRPITWRDVAAANGRELYCANCGGGLPARPHASCPYCQSAVGVLDPARLAKATALDRQMPDIAPDLRDHQQCQACGGPVDPTRDTACPQCQAIVRRKGTGDALAAIDAIRNAPREVAAPPRRERERERPKKWWLQDADDDARQAPERLTQAAALFAVVVLLYFWMR